MRKGLNAGVVLLFAVAFTGCASVPEPGPEKTPKRVYDAGVDFGKYWKGRVRVAKENDPALGSRAEVVFYSEWTRGETAGIVYPKTFKSVETGKTVEMDFKWDIGGEIEAGVYDVVVDVDGKPGKGRIRNLRVEGRKSYKVWVVFDAAKVDIEFENDGDDLFVYPAGTFDRYEKLGRIDDIPEDLLINHINSYTENNHIWKLIPAGVPLDVLRTYSNGKKERFRNFVAVPESSIKSIP